MKLTINLQESFVLIGKKNNGRTLASFTLNLAQDYNKKIDKFKSETNKTVEESEFKKKLLEDMKTKLRFYVSPILPTYYSLAPFNSHYHIPFELFASQMAKRGAVFGPGEFSPMRHLAPVIPKLQQEGGLSLLIRDIQLSDYYDKPSGVSFRENIMKHFPDQNFKKDVYPHLDKFHRYSTVPQQIMNLISGDLTMGARNNAHYKKVRGGAQFTLGLVGSTILSVILTRYYIIRARERLRTKQKYMERLRGEEEIYENLPNIKLARQAQLEMLKKEEE